MSQYNYQPLKLYQKSGITYTDVTATSGLGLGSNHGFAQVWDYNNDGWADIIMGSTDNVLNSTNANRVYKNLGTGSFTDVSTTLNLMNGNNYYRFVYPTELDNDGDLDVFFASTNHLFSNNNNGTFTADLISTSGLPASSNYGSFIDYNNDGKLDFLSQVYSQNIEVYKNITAISNNYINVKLHGCPNLKDPKGTRVCLYTSQGMQTRYFGNNKGGNGAFDQASNILHFGIGTSTAVDSIKVFWTNGGITKHYPTINTINHLYQLPSCNPATGIISLDNNKGINIYPNPTTEHLIVEFSNEDILANCSLKITNALGQVVLSTQLNNLSTNVNLNNLISKEIYFVYIIDSQNNIVDIKKIVLQ